MKLTYWVAKCVTDSDCYSIRTKTKKECQEKFEAADGGNTYEEPKKVTFEYDSGFELMAECMTEGGGYWE